MLTSCTYKLSWRSNIACIRPSFTRTDESFPFIWELMPKRERERSCGVGVSRRNYWHILKLSMISSVWTMSMRVARIRSREPQSRKNVIPWWEGRTSSYRWRVGETNLQNNSNYEYCGWEVKMIRYKKDRTVMQFEPQWCDWTRFQTWEALFGEIVTAYQVYWRWEHCPVINRVLTFLLIATGS